MKDKTPSMIQNGLNRWNFLRQKQITKEQIGTNIRIWTAAAWINVVLHGFFLAFMSKWIWAFYVSVGWYAVFVLAAFLHIYMWQKRRKDES
jgi:hypothetical protein